MKSSKWVCHGLSKNWAHPFDPLVNHHFTCHQLSIGDTFLVFRQPQRFFIVLPIKHAINRF